MTHHAIIIALLNKEKVIRFFVEVLAIRPWLWGQAYGVEVYPSSESSVERFECGIFPFVTSFSSYPQKNGVFFLLIW